MVEILKLLFVAASVVVIVLSVLFLTLLVVCMFVGAGVETCRCLARRFSSLKTAVRSR